MERMRNQEKVRENVKKWRKENREKYNEYARNYWKEKRRRLKELEEENKVIKEEKEMLIRQNTLLQESNKKLKKELEQAIYWKVDYEKSYKQADAKKDELLEENKKLNEDYKVLGILNDEIRRVNENLREENKKLKSDLEECECSMHFENDEVGYRKRECKKLKEEKEFFYKSAKQFREDSESWRKECERLLGLQICGKTIAERTEDDKKVLRE